MTNIWTFSPASQDVLQACLNAATPQNNANRWYREFGRKPVESELKCENREQDDVNTILIDINEDTKPTEAEESHKIDENILENIKSNPLASFGELVTEFMKNNKILSALALRLSSSAVEKMFNHIFHTKTCDINFIEQMHKQFLHIFLKRNQSWLSLDLLVKSYKTYTDIFLELFKNLLQDTEIPSKLLQDFMATLNDEEKSLFFNNIIHLEFSKEQFEHNLQLISTTYKECNKNSAVQSCIESIILIHSHDFVNDKNFGKFLLTFLQAQINIGYLSNYYIIEKVIENHRTPFKKPCFNMLKEVMEKYKP